MLKTLGQKLKEVLKVQEVEVTIKDVCPKCGSQIIVVAQGSNYKVWGCPYHRQFDSLE